MDVTVDGSLSLIHPLPIELFVVERNDTALLSIEGHAIALVLNNCIFTGCLPVERVKQRGAGDNLITQSGNLRRRQDVIAAASRS